MTVGSIQDGLYDFMQKGHCFRVPRQVTISIIPIAFKQNKTRLVSHLKISLPEICSVISWLWAVAFKLRAGQREGVGFKY